ncbi:uncharacterized protein LOC107037444 [Diachasma alloeum]|uniref:uncharacterized protein LOC107037444 n=1 Tax=Diachasma alloeum TaxID=454923 RepID=UPI0007382CAF|nr:uncharacterized protein LOC107037444 [Diachasma alloeum]XP_015111491.1 uncharacterized protein LOC107037444 [Diachasma alloeum]
MTSIAGSVEPVEKEVKVKESVTLVVGDTKSPEKSTKDAVKGTPGGPVPPAPPRAKKIPIVDPVAKTHMPANVPVPHKIRSNDLPENSYNLKPLVLSTHLVPSLPIELFELIAEIIEHSTQTPVVLIHESRVNRPVATEIVDIAFLPASQEWKDGKLLPVGLVFDHRLNTKNDPGVYADVVVAQDIAEHIEDIIDLRGYKVALPGRYTKIGGVGLLFNHLKTKGESPSFFGNTLDSETQVAALQMVAGKQTEVGVIEAPVINCHRYNLPGVNNLLILESLGPLPPYQILLNPRVPQKTTDQIKRGFLNAKSNPQWLDRLKSFGARGFAEYSQDNYDVEEIKTAVTSVAYY